MKSIYFFSFACLLGLSGLLLAGAAAFSTLEIEKLEAVKKLELQKMELEKAHLDRLESQKTARPFAQKMRKNEP